jgi:phage baseplate assembly protein W
MSKNIYKGFSGKKYKDSNDASFQTYNIECIKTDLLNHIFTIQGERVHMPEFGTRIPTLTFEPNDTEIHDIIREDLVKVCTYDPRVHLISINIYTLSGNNALIAAVKLLYLEFNVTEDLNLEIKSV